MTALQAAMATLSASKTDPKVGNGPAAIAPNVSTPAITASKKRKAKAPKLPMPPRRSVESVLTPKANGDDGLDIPEYLKVENRKPLTPEQQAKLDAAKAATAEKRDQLKAAIADAKEEKTRVRLAKKKPSAAMPLTGKAAQDAIMRATLIRPKPENGDSKIVAEAIQNGKAVHKVPAGQTYEQVMEAERDARRAQANKPTSKAPKAKAKASKQDRQPGTTEKIIGMLKKGATMDELCKAVNYSAHSMHGMFYRVRKMGNTIAFKDGKDGVRVYRIA